MIDIYLKMLDLGYFEAQEAFKGLSDENVWRRPSDTLLSIGELAGHLAFWEAVKFAGEGDGNSGPDLGKCRISSLLVDNRFRYYQTTIGDPPTGQQSSMTATRVCEELLHVHTQSIADFTSRNPEIDSTPPGWQSTYTYRWFLEYAIFHISYHTGQIYTVRHLLGETTPDN